MHKLFLFIILLLSSNVFAQKFIGIPFLDKCVKFSPCDLCDLKNPKTISYIDSIGFQLKKITEENETDWPIYRLAFINEELQKVQLKNTSSEAEQLQKKEVLGKLTLIKIQILVEEIINQNDTIYNLSKSEELNYGDFSGVSEINNLIEEVLKLNISESTNKYCRELRMKYMVESSAFIEISPEDFSWYEMNNLKNLKGISEDRVNAAKFFLEDEKSTDFVPFESFTGIGIGAVGAYGKGTWAGYEISAEHVEYSNPFRLNQPVSGGPHVRFSIIGTSYLWNMNDRSKQDLTFHLFNFKHPNLIVNLIQFGAHYGLADKAKWFYRPEIGFGYGIFKLGYSYNLTFDKSLRAQTEKSVFTFGISYPLFRLGDYR